MKKLGRSVWISLAAALLVGSVSLPTSAGPAEVAGYYRESYRLEYAGKPLEALQQMAKVRADAGPGYFLAARTGWLAYLAGKLPEAVAAYQEAIRLAPNAIEPKIGLTLPLLAGAKWRELELACREILKLDGAHAVARARLAAAFYGVGNYPDAAVVYRRLAEEYPAELDHKTGLGWALAKLGRVKDAKEIFAAVLAVSPDNPNALEGMALP